MDNVISDAYFCIKREKLRHNSSASFSFDFPVGHYLVGFDDFQLSYGDEGNHQVHEVKLELDHHLSGSVVSVTMNAVLCDSSGNKLSQDDSHCCVNVLAIADASVVADGAGEKVIAMTRFGMAFHLPSSINDNNIQFCGAEVMDFLSGKRHEGIVAGIGHMYDDSGHHGRGIALGNGAVMPTGLYAMPLGADFTDAGVKEAAVFLKQFGLKKNDTHDMQIQKIGLSVQFDCTTQTIDKRFLLQDKHANKAAPSCTANGFVIYTKK